MTKKVLIITGSLREKSLNRQLAQETAKLLEGNAQVSFLDYRDLPYMNQDMEFPTPETVKRVRSAVEAADGIWIFTPEYNRSYPGVLKNLLDWLSRPLSALNPEGIFILSGKKVTLSGVGGSSGASQSLEKLKELLHCMRMEVLNYPAVGIALDMEGFVTSQLRLSDADRTKLAAQVRAFLSFLEEK